MSTITDKDIKDHYSSEFLESLQNTIGLAQLFLSKAELMMDTSDAPLDSLYEHVESAYIETDTLYDRLCELTGRVRLIKKRRTDADTIDTSCP